MLIPGGTFRMGAQPPDDENPPGSPNVDPMAQSPEAPVHEVTLDAFFLSKYEMTLAQWERYVGEKSSDFATWTDEVGGKPVGGLNPVELVSWFTCREVLRQLGLVLPTEAQWEYAARGGTTTPWWTGEAKETLRGAANLADQSTVRLGEDWPALEEFPEFDDGYAVHAPVGSFRANPFGLYDVAGNVWEWCEDAFGSYLQPMRSGDGRREVPSDAPRYRVARGGCYGFSVSCARSSDRSPKEPETRSSTVGVRPARAITREESR